METNTPKQLKRAIVCKSPIEAKRARPSKTPSSAKRAGDRKTTDKKKRAISPKTPNGNKRSNTGGQYMIKKEDKLRILPQWQDDGDDEFEWRAEEDEDGGRIMIRGLVPGLPIHPTFRIEVDKLEVVSG